MRLASLLAALALGLTACAEVVVPMAPPTDDAVGKRFDPPPQGMAALYIVNTQHQRDTPAFNVSIGRAPIGGLASATWFRLDVPSGSYDVRAAGSDGSASKIMDLAPGTTRFLTIRFAHWNLTPILNEVAEREGKPLVISGRRAQEIR